nr:uncharacterized protein LOC113716020 [Coffea arabica]
MEPGSLYEFTKFFNLYRFITRTTNEPQSPWPMTGNEVQPKTTRKDANLNHFSRLSDSIIYHIYSFLPTRDVACTSILSKSWYRIWTLYSFVVYHFICTMWGQDEEQDEKGVGRVQECGREVPGPTFEYTGSGNRKDDFLSMAGKFIRRRFIENLNIQRFQLYIDFPKMGSLARRLDIWIDYAMMRAVPELVLRIDCLTSDTHVGHRINALSSRQRLHYAIPQFAVEARWLKILGLSGCRFATCLDIKLPQLQSLSLCHSCFDDKSLLERFLLGCPLVEYVKISFCNWMDKLLSVPNLPELKHFECLFCDMVDIIQINAAKLRTFSFATMKEVKELWPMTIDWTACATALKELKIYANGAADIDMLETPISQLLFLETLDIRGCESYAGFKISNKTLKRLIFRDCSHMSATQLDAPQLELLEFNNCDKPFLPCNASNKLQTIFSLFFRGHSIEWLLRLKYFLRTLKHWEDLKLIVYPEHQTKITEELPVEDMAIHDRLSKFVLEKARELSSSPGKDQRLISCELDTSEAVGYPPDPGAEVFNVKHSSPGSKASKITFMWKYDASQRRFIL